MRQVALHLAALALVAGIACNGLVVVANGGCMPVAEIPAGIVLDVPTVSSHCEATASSRLLWLADVHLTPLGWASVGDALLGLSLVLNLGWLAGRMARPVLRLVHV
jgi:hypothetical protein